MDYSSSTYQYSHSHSNSNFQFRDSDLQSSQQMSKNNFNFELGLSDLKLVQETDLIMNAIQNVFAAKIDKTDLTLKKDWIGYLLQRMLSTFENQCQISYIEMPTIAIIINDVHQQFIRKLKKRFQNQEAGIIIKNLQYRNKFYQVKLQNMQFIKEKMQLIQQKIKLIDEKTQLTNEKQQLSEQQTELVQEKAQLMLKNQFCQKRRIQTLIHMKQQLKNASVLFEKCLQILGPYAKNKKCQKINNIIANLQISLDNFKMEEQNMLKSENQILLSTSFVNIKMDKNYNSESSDQKNKKIQHEDKRMEQKDQKVKICLKQLDQFKQIQIQRPPKFIKQSKDFAYVPPRPIKMSKEDK